VIQYSDVKGAALSDEDPIELAYRPAKADAKGPSAWQLLGGIIGAMLGIVALSIGGGMVWVTLRLMGMSTRGSAPPSHSPHAIFVLLPALLCFFAASVMFRMSLRLFRGKP
jgi:hypothetical protein